MKNQNCNSAPMPNCFEIRNVNFKLRTNATTAISVFKIAGKVLLLPSNQLIKYFRAKKFLASNSTNFKT